MNFVRNIKNDKELIFSKLKSRTKDIEKYFYIKRVYKKGNIENNLGFQCVYKQFYVMNVAGLTDEFFKEYFKLLDSKEKDLNKILSRLSDIKRRNKTKSIQFCFATKLLHTIDNTLPIYDSLVGRMLGLKLSGESIKEKISNRISVYEELKEYYKKLMTNKSIKEIISDFKREFNCNKIKVSDAKILDFIIWAKGQIRK